MLQSEDNEVVQFGYSGGNGPDKWGSISPKFSTCSNGKSQSPIDIVQDKATNNDKLKPLDRDYYPANATLINNGFNVEVDFLINYSLLLLLTYANLSFFKLTSPNFLIFTFFLIWVCGEQ